MENSSYKKDNNEININEKNLEKNLLDNKRNKIEEIRILQIEISDIKEKESKTQNDIISYSDFCKNTKNKILNLENQIEFKEILLNDLIRKSNSINNSENIDSKEIIRELKTKLILKEIDNFFSQKVELLIWDEDTLLINANSFQNLMFNFISIIYNPKYDLNFNFNNNGNLENREKKIEYIISQNITFKQIKFQVSKFLNIGNDEKYIFADFAEGIIYNENIQVNAYLEQFSNFNNTFKILNINDIKFITNISEKQNFMIQDKNMLKQKVKDKINFVQNYDFDRNKFIINEFFKDYPLLKHYKSELTSSDFQNRDDNKYHVKFIESSNLSTSFFNIILSFIFFLFGIIFLYQSHNNIEYKSAEILFKNQFETKKITSILEINRFINFNLFSNLFSNKNYTLPNEYYQSCNNPKVTFCYKDYFNNLFYSYHIGNFIDLSTNNFDTSRFEKYIYEFYNNTIFNIISNINLNILSVNSIPCENNSLVNVFSLKFDCSFSFYNNDRKNTNIQNLLIENLNKDITISNSNPEIRNDFEVGGVYDFSGINVRFSRNLK